MYPITSIWPYLCIWRGKGGWMLSGECKSVLCMSEASFLCVLFTLSTHKPATMEEQGRPPVDVHLQSTVECIRKLSSSCCNIWRSRREKFSRKVFHFWGTPISIIWKVENFTFLLRQQYIFKEIPAFNIYIGSPVDKFITQGQ
jgi:hypothetical protein